MAAINPGMFIPAGACHRQLASSALGARVLINLHLSELLGARLVLVSILLGSLASRAVFVRMIARLPRELDNRNMVRAITVRSRARDAARLHCVYPILGTLRFGCSSRCRFPLFPLPSAPRLSPQTLALRPYKPRTVGCGHCMRTRLCHY
ncbi:hypothetical protein [Nocardia sp. NPDC005998]|uniref:hypothetical protein n=1 Tax=Nocardia sp. NPDC005998 TaxID=3156894 RepID=UPI00339FDA2A